MRECWLCLVALFVLDPCARASDPQFPIAVSHDGIVESNRYCGLYCVYQAGRLTGRDIDLDRLIRAERLNGEFGSTAGDLVGCCREFGINCSYLPNGSYVDVCLLGGPVIVLVKNGPESQRPNHWIMILKADPAWAEVYDPSAGVIRISAAELKTLWGGPVIVVFAESDESEVGIAWAMTKVGLICATAGLALILLRSFGWMRLHPALTVVFTGAGLTVAAHVADPSGFVHNADVLKQVDRARRPRTPDRISPSELLGIRESALVIDARTQPQFNDARIPGAINIPITSAYRRNLRKLATVPMRTRIVVYCNSESCPWAETLARSSLLQNFESVAVLDGGLEGYEAAGGKLTFGPPQSSEAK